MISNDNNNIIMIAIIMIIMTVHNDKPGSPSTSSRSSRDIIHILLYNVILYIFMITIRIGI